MGQQVGLALGASRCWENWRAPQTFRHVFVFWTFMVEIRNHSSVCFRMSVKLQLLEEVRARTC